MSNDVQLTPYVTHLKSLCENPTVLENHELWEDFINVDNAIGQDRMRSLVIALGAMAKDGDRENFEREIFHWAYFPSRKKAKFFAKRLLKHGYSFIGSGPVRKSKRICVQFSYFGPAELFSMAEHIAHIEKMISGTQGIYDGWETSVERSPETASGFKQASKTFIDVATQ